MQEQLNRMEEKLDKYIDLTVTNTADIVWLKRGILGAMGTFFTLTAAYLFNLITGT